MFREAVKFSPSGNIDIVVANAGLVSLQDSIFTPESTAILNCSSCLETNKLTVHPNSIGRTPEASLEVIGRELERRAVHVQTGIVLL